MLFRMLLTGSASAGNEQGDWSASQSSLVTETSDLANGAVVSSVGDRSPAGVLLQAGSGDRPVLDNLTAPGTRLLSFDSDDRLAGTITGTTRTVVVVFWVPASPAPRVLVARDTSATTTKPAFNIGLTA